MIDHKILNNRPARLCAYLRDIALISLVAIFVAWQLYLHCMFNPSPSETIGYYWISHTRDYHANDKVVICITKKPYTTILDRLGLKDHGICGMEGFTLLKTIAAVPGDTVTITTHGIFINGVLAPNSCTVQSFHHIALAAQKPASYQLIKDQYFVLGQSVHSYDSRYFGIVYKS